jgi:hypothetical protein
MSAREASAAGRRCVHGVRASLARMRAPMLCGVLVLVAIASACPGAYAAAAPAPHWSITTFAAPTRFHVGDPADYYTLIARNNGAAATDGATITLTDHLPAGITATAMEGRAESLENAPLGSLTCEAAKPTGGEAGEAVTCNYTTATSGPPTIEADETIWVRIAVSVAPGAEPCTSCQASVSGGGAPPALTPDPTVISPEAAAFGFSRFDVEAVEANGEPDRQAGSHPYELNTSFALNVAALDTEPKTESEGLYHDSPILAAAAKDIAVELPPGLVGNPNAVPRCSQAVFQSDSDVRCPADSQVGIITYDTAGQAVEGAPNEDAVTSAVYDVEPPAGQPAELGFQLNTVKVHIFFHLRSDGRGDYGLTAQTPEITQLKPLMLANLTIWGTPAEASHDNERSGALRPGGGSECLRPVEVKSFEGEEHALQTEIETNEREVEAAEEQLTQAEEHHDSKRVKALEREIKALESEELEAKLSLAELEGSGAPTLEGCASDAPAKPFLRMPTSCHAAPLGMPALADSWADPEAFVAASPEPKLEASSECEGLTFEPGLSVIPERDEPTTPSGYTVAINLPQDEEPGSLGTPDVKSATVSLPAGIVASPSAANGLAACTKSQFARLSDSVAVCPPASQLGVVKILSPLLPSPGYIEGQLYLGEPECSPCDTEDAVSGHMIRLFLQAQGFGVTVKLEGFTSLNESTGQLSTTFTEDPQLPFAQLVITTHGGPRAPLANPSSCGAFTATSAIEPWSAPHTPTASPVGTFEIGGCAAPRFAPSFEAGPVNLQAGAFSPFVLTFSRTDEDQTLQSVTVQLPPGELGMVANVPRCPEPQAELGQCGPESEIGATTTSSGPGPSPFYLGGKVYLTGPYHGAPFGLSIVEPVVAGPFNLGNVVVRAAIEVNPDTSQITAVSNPLPRIVDGIPTQIKAVNVDIDRGRFMFNPSNCSPLQVHGTLTSTAGASTPVAANVEAANCANLPFHPVFEAQSSGHTSKAQGASLRVRITSAGLGQANIAKTKVALPLQLPSRESTLQKACLAATFEANPESCPEGSNVGTATVQTPVLGQPLRGPAYLVSHAGAEFPHLELVLQSEGVKIILDGKTDIKKGITTTSFESLPDAPFTSFELNLPEGPHSALATYSPTTNLCALPKVAKTIRESVPLRSHGHLVEADGRVVDVTKSVKKLVPGSLAMPTTITAESGAVVNQNTAISVQGCEGVKSFKAHKKPKQVKKPK